MKPQSARTYELTQHVPTLLALWLGDTRNGVVARSTRHTWPSTKPKKSRKRNGLSVTTVLDINAL